MIIFCAQNYPYNIVQLLRIQEKLILLQQISEIHKQRYKNPVSVMFCYPLTERQMIVKSVKYTIGNTMSEYRNAENTLNALM